MVSELPVNECSCPTLLQFQPRFHLLAFLCFPSWYWKRTTDHGLHMAEADSCECSKCILSLHHFLLQSAQARALTPDLQWFLRQSRNLLTSFLWSSKSSSLLLAGYWFIFSADSFLSFFSFLFLSYFLWFLICLSCFFFFFLFFLWPVSSIDLREVSLKLWTLTGIASKGDTI